MIDEKKGLPNNTVYGILPDETGALWLSSNKGLSRYYPPADLQKTSVANFTVFTSEDGLQSSEFNTGASYKSKEETLFFGGINGLNFFQPTNFRRNAAAAPIVITNALLDNEPLQSDTAIQYKKILRLPFNNNSIAFNFAALNFVSAGRLNYYYQMVGYDDSWINAGNRQYAAYTNLPPGNYIFKVKTSLTGAEKPASINIIIEPPFWKTIPFIGFIFLLIIAALYALYRYRINSLLKMQTVRNRIATDLHDDIGSTLTNINILSALSQQKLSPAHEASPFLQRISEEINSSNQALDDIIWSVNTNNDTLEETLARMRRYAAELLEAGNINYHLTLDEKISGKKLNMEKRRDIFLLYKEGLNNIYKHAKASEVWIETKCDKGVLYLIIKDNGQGFNVSNTSHRNGLKNIAARVKKWQGKLYIESNDAGTCINIEIPV